MKGDLCFEGNSLLLRERYGWVGGRQALTGSRISIPGFFGTGFSNIFDPGIKEKNLGFFGIFIFASFACQIG